MYKDTLPNLYARYPFENFEVIAEAVDNYFPHLFKLDILNAEAGKVGSPGSYLAFFHLLIKNLRGNPADGSLFTVEEIIRKIYQEIKTEVINKYIQENFIFIPPQGDKTPTQLATLEKIATGQGKFPEPVTYLDMLRAIHGLDMQIKTQHPRMASYISVMNLNDLPALDLSAFRKTERLSIINVNKDPKGLPKWAVVQLKKTFRHFVGMSYQDARRIQEEDREKDPLVRIYCEMPLTEGEKADIEAIFGEVTEYRHEGAHSLASTGYKALAQAEDLLAETTQGWRSEFLAKRVAEAAFSKRHYRPYFQVDGDFPAIFRTYTELQFGGDSPGKAYTIMPSEKAYCARAFLDIANPAFIDPKYPRAGITADSNTFSGGLAFHILSTIAMLGTLRKPDGAPLLGAEGRSWRPGDISATINALSAARHISPADYRFFYAQGIATLIPDAATALLGYTETNVSYERYTSFSSESHILEDREDNSIFTIPKESYPGRLIKWLSFYMTLPYRYSLEGDHDKGNRIEEALIQALTHLSGGEFSEAGAGAGAPVAGRTVNLSDPSPATARAVQAIMFFTFLRSRAQKSTLTINVSLPDRTYGSSTPAPIFQFTPEEQALAITLLSENTTIQNFYVPEEHASLKAIQQAIIPILARNEWLHHSGYTPALIDEPWKQVAKYWLLYLHKDTIFIDKPDCVEGSRDALKEYNKFKRCVRNMGMDGLDAVLALLTDPDERKLFERIFSAKKIPFYGSCPPHETSAYLKRLCTYLRHEEAYFPFGDLSLSYAPGADEYILELASITNQKSFDATKIILRNAIENPADCLATIRALTIKARERKWTSFIVIPELSEKQTIAAPALQELQSAYRLLNDIIITNRHASSLQLLEPLLEETPARAPDLTPAAGGAGAGAGERAGAGIIARPMDKASAALDILPEGSAWPLRKSGGIQLQIQQQLQLEQNRQLELEQQRTLATADEGITGVLIDYSNIHTVPALTTTEEPFDPAFAPITAPREHILQRLFHTWVNANPTKNAPHVISKMTLEAVQLLLKNYRKLSSGLNPDNLPKGFFLQRSSKGDLILCYNAQRAQIAEPTPLTLVFDDALPKIKPWLGDFRQLHLERYLSGMSPLDVPDWQHILIFAHLQPARTSYAEDFRAFLIANPDLNELSEAQRLKITTYWPIFLQLWQYKGNDGLTAFLAKADAELQISPAVIYEQLLHTQPAELKSWFAAIAKKEMNFLRSLGQVRFLHGEKGLTILLTQFKRLHDGLGIEFFNAFQTAFSGTNSNISFDCFMNTNFFNAVSGMIETLSAKEAHLKTWQTILLAHMQGVQQDNIEKLWEGFTYFLNELKLMDLKLTGEEFIGIPPGNMLVYMDRLLACLKEIPTLAMQKEFLATFHAMDMSHGGVHYALKYDGLRHIDPSLQLTNFVAGNPSYAVRLQQDFRILTPLEIRRLLAQKPLDRTTYEELNTLLPLTSPSTAAETAIARKATAIVMLLLHTEYPGSITETAHQLQRLDENILLPIANMIHEAVFANPQFRVNLDAVMRVIPLFPEFLNQTISLGWKTRFAILAESYKGTFFEILNILHQRQLDDATLSSFIRTLVPFMLETEQNIMGLDRTVPLIYQHGYKLAALFNVKSKTQLTTFFNEFFTEKEGFPELKKMPLIVEKEINLLLPQLLSIDLGRSNRTELNNTANWTDLITAIKSMKSTPAEAARIRTELIARYISRGFHFNYSKQGRFRVLSAAAHDKPANLRLLGSEEERVWAFLQSHIVIPPTMNGADVLKPIVSFMRSLQASKTYINELEQLLIVLRTVRADEYWSADYFYQLLYILQPREKNESYPIPLLKLLLQNGALASKSLDAVEEQLPDILKEPLKTIAQHTLFDSEQKALLCSIAIKEQATLGNITTMPQVIFFLEREEKARRDCNLVLTYLAGAGGTQLSQRFNTIQSLFQESDSFESSQVWLKAMSSSAEVENLFAKVISVPEKSQLLLSILAWSGLDSLLSSGASAEEYLFKLKKLTRKLQAMPLASLALLAQCYPALPYPTSDDILRIIKKASLTHSSFTAELERFLRSPMRETRADYAVIAATREHDLHRLFEETQLTKDGVRRPLSAEEKRQITPIFSMIKQIEKGEIKIAIETGTARVLSEMSQAELASTFSWLSRMTPQTELSRAQILSILFEVMGRTTGKYPHLAQQFALVVNSLCNPGNSRISQVATGEGKSHFIAMRAALYAGQGLTVDICTAKRSLAIRDQEEYERFFKFLGLSSAYIHPTSTGEAYQTARIHYSTAGDLSLFLDKESFRGAPVSIPREKRVGLLDEADAVLFKEGLKTQCNYAKPTGRTPTEMMWFYQAINAFYTMHQADIATRDRGIITIDRLRHLQTDLKALAGDNEDKLALIDSVICDPLKMVQWLQAAQQAHELKEDTDFTVISTKISAGHATYELREIIPLSDSNQKLTGSTFSGGVHQLLAVRLNIEAKATGKPQDFHVHLESDIISSRTIAQRMNELWGQWEGFTGTISAIQTAKLAEIHKTDVLHIPTNLSDLRVWEEPLFCASEDERILAVATNIRSALHEKKSILISCKDDKQTKDIEHALRTLNSSTPPFFSEEEISSLIFYTASDERTPEQLLAAKRAKEDWRHGTKQRGTCVIASGFGRGDNMNVDGVFILDASDMNDLLQKGGRTARNGAEGSVHYFCLRDALQAEEISYRTSGIDFSPLDEIFVAQGIGRDTDLDRFKRIMALREHLFNVQNEATEHYWNLRSLYSAGGMALLGKTHAHHSAQEKLTGLFSESLQALEKQWVTLVTMPSLTSIQKIAAIGKAFQEAAVKFTGEYNEIIGHLGLEEVPPFVIPLPAELKPPAMTLVVPPATAEGVTGAGAGAGSESSYRQGLRRIANRFGADVAADLLARMERALGSNPRKSLPMLTKWEGWSTNLSLTDAHTFLIDFCSVMEQYQDKAAWPVFEALVNKTQAWWSKDLSGAYQPELIQLWKTLASKKADVLSLTDTIYWHFSHRGKSWFNLMSHHLSLETGTLHRHQAQIRALWKKIDESNVKKADKTKLFKNCVEGLNVFYAVIEALDTQPALQAQLLRLDTQRFQWILELTAREKVVLLAERQLLPLILQWATGHLPLNEVNKLSSILLRAAPLLREAPDNMAALMAQVNRLIALRETSPRKYNFTLDLLNNQFDKLVNHREMRDLAINLICHPTNTDDKSELFAQLIVELLNIPGSAAFHSAWINGLRHYQDAPIEKLQLLSQRLIANPSHVSKILFDGSTDYLFACAADERPLKESVIQLVYNRPAEALATINSHPNPRQERRFLMHLLQHNYLLTREGVPATASWGGDQNTDLLAAGLLWYSNTFAALLAPQAEEAHPSRVRDLTAIQQRHLTELADDMLFIAKRTPDVADPAPVLPVLQQGLKDNLSQLMVTYKSNWFKSSTRVAKITELEAAIIAAPTYKIALDLIQAAKLEIMESDRTQDRHRWFKLNRTGESRLFKTLNKMEDTLLKHWVAHADVTSFHVYKKFSKDEFINLARILKIRLREEEQEINRSVSYLFSSRTRYQQRLRPLINALEPLSLDEDVDLEALNIVEIMTAIRHSLAVLPGHLVTIAREVQEHGECLAPVAPRA